MGKQWVPKRVRSEDERGSGSGDYITLDEGEKFLGYALFEGNPAEDEPGYYEYMEHWNNASRRSIPCAGDDCPFCEEGDRAKTRAKTLWFVSKDAKNNVVDKVMTFNFNFSLIKQFTEMRGEGDKIKGRLFRISKLDDRGNFGVMPKDGSLKAGEIKEHLKGGPDFDGMVTSTLRKAMEGIAVARALDDDDDDDEPAEKPKKKDKPAKAEKTSKKKTADWPEEGEDEEVTVVSVDTDDNTMIVTSDAYDDETVLWGTEALDLSELSEDDVVTVSWETDSDDDKVLSALEAAEAPTDGGAGAAAASDGLPDTIEDEEFVVTDISADEFTMEVKSDSLDLEFTLFFLDSGPASEVDFDDYEVGTKIKLSAEKDSTGDMVATEVPEIIKDKAKGGKGAKKDAKKPAAKKTSKKK